MHVIHTSVYVNMYMRVWAIVFALEENMYKRAFDTIACAFETGHVRV